MRVAGNAASLLAGILLLAAAGCSSDGGVGGTGISTVRGNVIADGEVRVRELGTRQELTSEGGFFELTGAFDGDVTLEFQADGTPGAAVLTLPVGAGSEVTLTNVVLAGGEAVPERVFVDRLTLVLEEDAQCAAGAGSVRGTDSLGVEFLLEVDGQTRIERNGAARACADLVQGLVVKVRGVQEEHRILAERVEIVRSRSG